MSNFLNGRAALERYVVFICHVQHCVDCSFSVCAFNLPPSAGAGPRGGNAASDDGRAGEGRAIVKSASLATCSVVAGFPACALHLSPSLFPRYFSDCGMRRSGLRRDPPRSIGRSDMGELPHRVDPGEESELCDRAGQVSRNARPGGGGWWSGRAPAPARKRHWDPGEHAERRPGPGSRRLGSVRRRPGHSAPRPGPHDVDRPHLYLILSAGVRPLSDSACVDPAETMGQLARPDPGPVP